MADLSKWTNARIVREYDRLRLKSNKTCDKLVAAGFGELKPSEMRARVSENKLFSEYISTLDRMQELSAEARGRYGPGFVGVFQLRWV